MNNNEGEPKPGGHVKGPTKTRHPRGARTQKVQFKEAQPIGRYNLAFYANYKAKKDKKLKIQDNAYLTIFHKTFPRALKNHITWATKTPQSRVCCECHLIKEVSSLVNLFREIEFFIGHGPRVQGLEEKFGTIFVCAHGNPNGLVLPIADGSRSIPFQDLDIGLKNVDFLGSDCPREWPKKTWRKLRKPFSDLKDVLGLLHGKQSWFDSRTLIRLWCCNLGRQRASGMDALRFFGERLVGGNGHIMVEAPRCRCVTFPEWYTRLRPQHFRRVFRKDKRRKWWHPDIVAETESDNNNVRFKKDAIGEAQKDFIDLILQRGRRRCWIPFFALEGNRGRLVYQGQYQKFRNLWRTVTI